MFCGSPYYFVLWFFRVSSRHVSLSFFFCAQPTSVLYVAFWFLIYLNVTILSFFPIKQFLNEQSVINWFAFQFTFKKMFNLYLFNSKWLCLASAEVKNYFKMYMENLMSVYNFCFWLLEYKKYFDQVIYAIWKI